MKSVKFTGEAAYKDKMTGVSDWLKVIAKGRRQKAEGFYVYYWYSSRQAN